MDNLTQVIMSEVKKQFKSVRQFAIHLEIPQTTVVSALKKGLKGTAYETVIRMCDALHIKTLNNAEYIVIDEQTEQVLRTFNSLDEKGKHALITVLKIENERCEANC